MISKAAVGIAVGIAGIFVGYCFYFDQKRRSDPDFKKKLRERKSSVLIYSHGLDNYSFLLDKLITCSHRIVK